MLKKILAYFSPQYTETSLFLAILILILLGKYNVEFSSLFVKAIFENPGILLNPFLFVITLGATLTLFAVVWPKKMPKLAKSYMLSFIIVLDFLVALFAYKHIYETNPGGFYLFPTLNAIHAILIFLLARHDLINESAITDKNATWKSLLLGCVLTGIIFYICQYQLSLHWTIIFSITLGYSTLINGYIERLFIKKEPIVLN